MKNKKLFILTIFLTLGFSQENRPYVLLISFDGFRADYREWYDTPNMDAFAENGVSADKMQPVYVTKTFPNHYTLATGMYIENHGLIDNFFYDPILDDTYKLSDRTKVEDTRFYGGEPIWVTAEKQGVKSASMFWVGSEAPISGIQPSIWKRYDHHMPFYSRIDSVASWFSLPEDRRPHFVALYFHEPDETSHQNGVTSPQTKSIVESLDSLLGVIVSTMGKLDIANNLNIVVVSDHGMADLSPDRVITLSDYVNLDGVTQERNGPFSFLYNIPHKRAKKIVENLNKAPHLTAYLKEDIPERYHFKNHYRIKQILLVADEGWSILDEKRIDDPKHMEYMTSGATHGYDNQLQSMQAIFLADGPAFKDGYRRDSMENIQVYPIVAEILGIEPNPAADGKIEDVKDLFRE